MFSSFSSLMQTASETAKRFADDGVEWVKQSGVLDLEEGFNDEAGGKATAAERARDATTPTADVHVDTALLVRPPPHWESSAEEWRVLREAALMEENGCVVPPSTITGNTQLAAKLCELLRVAAADALPSPPRGLCTPSAAVVDMLTASPEQLRFRSSLVPRYVSDEQYWANVWWRFQLYHMCRDSAQLLDVMDVATTEPNPRNATGQERIKNVGTSNSAVYWQQLRQQMAAEREQVAWIEEQEKKVTREMELASDNLQLLVNILKKRETSDLGNSVCESCKYHKTKLVRIVGDLKSQQEKLQGSSLCTENGSLFIQLMEMNDRFRSVIEAYAALLSGAPSEKWEVISGGDRKEATHQHGSGTPPEVDDSREGGNDEAVFEVALPWGDEEDEDDDDEGRHSKKEEKDKDE